MSDPKMTRDEMAQEAARWSNKAPSEGTWQDAPERVPRAGESTTISIRLPSKMLTILKAFAGREAIGYQVLMKRWLEDRIRIEAERLAPRPTYELSTARIITKAAVFLPPSESSLITREGAIDEIGRLAERIRKA